MSLGEIEYLLNSENEVPRPNSWVRDVARCIPSILDQSVEELCEDLNLIRTEYRNDWQHPIPMDRMKYENYSNYAVLFFRKWF